MKHTGNPLIDNSRAGTVIGSDEVGYGSWAGPLVVAAVATPRSWSDPRVTDSKALTARQREAIYEEFWLADGFPMAVEIVPAPVIDQKRVGPALIEAHEKAIRALFFRLSEVDPLIIVDGTLKTNIGIALPKADLLIPAVSLASVIAKVTHDRIMIDLDKHFPGYHFSSNMGYGGGKTSQHQIALDTLGPCPVHRRSYEPVRRAEARMKQQTEPEWSILDDDLV